MKIRRLSAILLAVVMLLGVAACNGKTEPSTTGGSPDGGDNSPTASASAPPAGGDSPVAADPGKDTLYIGQTTALGSFNFGSFGHQPTLMSFVTDFIFDWNPDTGEIYSRVLSDWHYIDDLTISMTVNQGITFTNGDPMTAEDVLFTLQSYTLKGSPFEPTVAWIDFANSTVSGDGYELTLKCNYPYSPFITVQPQPIVSKKWCEENGWETLDWYNNPCGTGPYKVVEYVADDHYKFELRDNYWDDASQYPYKYVVARYYGNASSMYIDLENGTLDLAVGINVEDYDRTLAGGNANIAATTTTGDYFLVQMWNPNGEYTSNPRVRRAIEMAVDWGAIAEMTYGSIAMPSRTAVPKLNRFYDASIQTVQYDPEGARQILEEEGIKAGDVKLKILTTSANETYATGLQSYLSEAGITLNIEFMDFMTMQQTLFTSDDPELTNTFGGPAFAHPWGTLVNTIKASTTWPQHTFVDDPAYDELTTKIEQTIGDEALMPLYKQLQEYVAENNPFTPIAITRAGVAYNTNVISKAIFTNVTEAEYKHIVYAGQ
ncbi:MAG: ABC transporter substrate-binding protein [Oscillospiraceae bacterium]|jgi:peptide/nickel transport system substrate-binding protein|nr:ABC transporter substrate-binding protein [Oscillospiraceae bacterium]